MNQTPGRVQFERDVRGTLRIPRPIDVVQLQTTASIVFTARDDADFEIEGLYATNVTGSADTVTVYLVPGGGSPGLANAIVFQRNVPPNFGVTIFNRENTGFLQPGMTLRALCATNNAVNLWGHGFDYQGTYSNG